MSHKTAKRTYSSGGASILSARVCEIAAIIVHGNYKLTGEAQYAIQYDKSPRSCIVQDPSRKPIFILKIELAAFPEQAYIATDGEESFYIDLSRTYAPLEMLWLTVTDREHIRSAIKLWVENPDTREAYYSTHSSSACSQAASTITTAASASTVRPSPYRHQSFNPLGGNFQGPQQP